MVREECGMIFRAAFLILALALSGCASSSNSPAYWAAVSHSVGEHVGHAPP